MGAKGGGVIFAGVSIVDVMAQTLYCTYQGLLSQSSSSQVKSGLLSFCSRCERSESSGLLGLCEPLSVVACEARVLASDAVVEVAWVLFEEEAWFRVAIIVALVLPIPVPAWTLALCS